MDDTVKRMLAKLKKEDHVVADSEGERFLDQDHLFTYFPGENPAPLKIRKAPSMRQTGPRQIEPVRGMREGIQIRFGNRVWEGKKSDGANYWLIFEREQTELKISGWWNTAQVRQEGPKIIVEAAPKPDHQPPAVGTRNGGKSAHENGQEASAVPRLRRR